MFHQQSTVTSVLIRAHSNSGLTQKSWATWTQKLLDTFLIRVVRAGGSLLHFSAHGEGVALSLTSHYLPSDQCVDLIVKGTCETSTFIEFELLIEQDGLSQECAMSLLRATCWDEVCASEHNVSLFVSP